MGWTHLGSRQDGAESGAAVVSENKKFVRDNWLDALDEDYATISAVADSLDKWSVGGNKDAAPIQGAVLCLYGVLARRTVRKGQTPEGCTTMRNEDLADLYIRLSGTNHHASDCATSVAPAETPGPCDCAVRREEPAKLDAEIEKAVQDRDDRWEKALQAENFGKDFTIEVLKRCRARIEAKPKTLQERVDAILTKYHVRVVDGIPALSAEIVAQLKQQEKERP